MTDVISYKGKQFSLIRAALRCIQADWNEPNAHSDDEQDYAYEMLDLAARELANDPLCCAPTAISTRIEQAVNTLRTAGQTPITLSLTPDAYQRLKKEVPPPELTTFLGMNIHTDALTTSNYPKTGFMITTDRHVTHANAALKKVERQING